jgi:hypothetical protein
MRLLPVYQLLLGFALAGNTENDVVLALVMAIASGFHVLPS